MTTAEELIDDYLDEVTRDRRLEKKDISVFKKLVAKNNGKFKGLFAGSYQPEFPSREDAIQFSEDFISAFPTLAIMVDKPESTGFKWFVPIKA